MGLESFLIEVFAISLLRRDIEIFKIVGPGLIAEIDECLISKKKSKNNGNHVFGKCVYRWR